MLGWKNIDRIMLLTTEHIKSVDDGLLKERSVKWQKTSKTSWLIFSAGN